MMDHNITKYFNQFTKTLAMFAGLPNTVAEWEAEGLSNEWIKPSFMTNHGFSTKPERMNSSRISLRFRRSYLK